MTKASERSGNRLSFRRAREAYARGENVTLHLQNELKADENTSTMIEMVYDLQAGSYVDWVKQNREFTGRYTAETAQVLDSYLSDGDTLLDVGTGELTTFSLVASQLKKKVSALYAFDISWSRIHCGLGFAKETLSAEQFSALTAFVGDISAIPLRSKSIDVTTSYHAVEPNGGRERAVLSELLRISRRKLVLFEPSYERNSDKGRARMDRLGYIKDLEGHARALGAKVEDVLTLSQIDNPDNPTFAYILVPEMTDLGAAGKPAQFSDPGSDDPLTKLSSCYFSPESGMAYPIIEGIPVLKDEVAVLTSALSKGL